jgi:hypothetical protein
MSILSNMSDFPLRIIQARIIYGNRFTDPGVLMFSVADNHYVASSDVAVSLKKSANRALQRGRGLENDV